MPRLQTSLELRSVIVALSKTGNFTFKKIASIVRRDRSTVGKSISRYKTQGILLSGSHPG
jgi:transposase